MYQLNYETKHPETILFTNVTNLQVRNWGRAHQYVMNLFAVIYGATVSA